MSTSDVPWISRNWVSALVQGWLLSSTWPSAARHTLSGLRSQGRLYTIIGKPSLASEFISLILHRNGLQKTETPVSCKSNKARRVDQTPNAANDIVFVSTQLGQAHLLLYSLNIICCVVTQDACMAAHPNTQSIDRQRWDHTCLSCLETSLDNPQGHSAFFRSLQSPDPAPANGSPFESTRRRTQSKDTL